MPPSQPLFKRVSIDSLHEDPANARKHPERNRRTVRASLQEFGQVEALVVQKGTGRVIGGNARLGELRALGVTEVDVCEVDVQGVEAARLGLVLNRSAETAEWDQTALTDLLAVLGESDALEGLGWDDGEIEALLGGSDPGDDPPKPDVDLDFDTDLVYSVVARCEDEHTQAALMQRLESEGYTCQPLIS